MHRSHAAASFGPYATAHMARYGTTTLDFAHLAVTERSHAALNKKAMMRVMRNHRLAAYDADEYEQLSVKPQGIHAKYCPDYLLKAACKAWDDALQLGERFGYRNAQVSVIAPTGTIGLVMDCDTTGVEPDFALIKFKKLCQRNFILLCNGKVRCSFFDE